METTSIKTPRREAKLSAALEDWQQRKTDRAPLKHTGKHLPGPDKTLQAPHINVLVFARGLPKGLPRARTLPEYCARRRSCTAIGYGESACDFVGTA